ncbi:MAG: RagB/SusD family nutrient uptake outer membrane protein [Sphingobacterium sp.]|uniref:RagB/SusD family nutrient uptake outer membrane protein n=1 Tax=Sphingobacterium sp. JB170 TaxID=1434842 RepID=UPI000B350F12|nr:RagB/SusD family nutrient uptake outer membrane protein [Sphingobacterium sp. JB170]
MEKIHIYILLALTLIFGSCSDKLELDPTDAVSDTEIFKTTTGIETVVNGTWGYLNDTYFTYANPGYSTVMRTSDAMGNDVAVTTKYGYRDPYAFTDLNNKTATRVRAVWTLLYKVIDNSNNVIAKVDQAEGSQQQKDVLKGQALTLRAFAYLNLATYYQLSYLKDKNALSVPIYTEPSTIETQGKPKASLEEVYTLIKSDLNQADGLLKDYVRDASKKYKIDQHVVNGLQARTYLNTGEWEEAAQSAKQAREGYQLMAETDYLGGFNDIQNTEWIWGHIQTTEQSEASYTFHYLDVSSPGSYYYSFMADPYFKDLFDTQDIRNELFEWDGEDGREGFLRYKKFRFKSNLIGDIVYMRSAEMLLIEAEGYARAGNSNNAIAALNSLRSARKAKLFNAADGKNIIDEILLERRKELWGEGFALSDILRTQSKVERKEFKNADGSSIQVTVTKPDGTKKQASAQGHRVVKFPDGTDFIENSRYYIFSIPQSEEQQNPNL